MAKIYDKDNNAFLHIGVPFNYNRGNPMPLDNTSVWTSKADAENYAKNSPLAYVGQQLVVVNKDVGTVESFVVGSDSTLELTSSSSVGYEKLSRVVEFLFYMEYSDLDYTTAGEFFKTHYPTPNRGLGVRFADKLGCNADTPYDEAVDFVVEVKATPLRRGSVAVCGGLTDLNRDLVNNKQYHPKYKVLPFCIRDGINDAGVAVFCSNVPTDFGKTEHTNPGGTPVEAMMLPRIILDTYINARTAVAAVKNLFDVTCSNGEIHLLVADAAETYSVEFKNNETIVTKLETCTWMTGFNTAGVTVSSSGTVDYKTSGISPHGHGIERWNAIADRFNEMHTSFDVAKFLQGEVVGTGIYTDISSPRYSDIASGDLTIDKIVDEPELFEAKMEEVRAKYPTRSRADGNTIYTSHSSVYDFRTQKLMIVTQEQGVSKGLYFPVGKQKKAGAVNFAACWDLNSTETSIDGTRLHPHSEDGVFGWTNEDAYSLTYGNGKWSLTTPAGSTQVFAGGEETELVIENYPSVGDTTVLFKHESDSEGDRLVTASEPGGGGGGGKDYGPEIAELFSRLGDGFYRLTTDTVFVEGTEYYTKQDNLFTLAIAGTDYTIGDSVPSDTYYTKYTAHNLSNRVFNLERVKADKATTLAGYGIVDACISGEKDQEVIQLGSKTIAVATRSYVDGAVNAEAKRASEAEKALGKRLASRTAAYVTGQTLNLTTGDIPDLELAEG